MSDLFDNIGNLLIVLVGSILLLFLPLVVTTNKMDVMSQNIIDNAVYEFVDNARGTAIITDEAYEKLVRTVDSAQKFCVIEITHGEKIAIPNGTDVETGYYHYTTPEILNIIYAPAGPNQRYEMSNGDFLKVTVYNTEPTLGTKLYRMFVPGYGSTDMIIYTTYTGYVGNNPQ